MEIGTSGMANGSLIRPSWRTKIWPRSTTLARRSQVRRVIRSGRALPLEHRAVDGMLGGGESILLPGCGLQVRSRAAVHGS
jgi:hypothetical protein